MRVAVLGAGAWGTALALVLHRRLHDVVLWGHHAGHLADIESTGRNERYLPGIEIPNAWIYESDMAKAIQDCEAVVVAIPSKSVREATGTLAGYRGIIVSVTKGIDYDTGATMGSVLGETAPRAGVAALSGPTLALEVARGVPSAIVAGSADSEVAHTVQQMFHSPTFRVYTTSDRLGVEFGGALKNVVALAAGVGDGLGFGDNSKAALLTRGIMEIRRLGVACGAQPDTFAGLSGLGDLSVTCFSKLSRNRSLGERLGRGEKLADVLARSISVAEGYPTTRAAFRLARERGVYTPIIDETHAVLYEGKNVAKALQDLVSRESKPES
ncbi:MAG TPA: NAD(P)H-dependent glycerol-3-phosphate dehydrogenase [Verrucomicrobiae bacterium]|nr:NAD(P)H-dependent glycerol-3-phosphate dehydrogenase [Verrucomicrobiae bacterium]